MTELEVKDDVDLLALAAEECSRYPHAQLDGTVLSLDGDPRLVLRKLLENAERRGIAPTRVQIALVDGDAQIIVSDKGPGIPAEQCERMFEPHYRRVQAGESIDVGLGLAVVRQIARRHGGDGQCVQGEDEQHSCFVVRLSARGTSE